MSGSFLFLLVVFTATSSSVSGQHRAAPGVNPQQYQQQQPPPPPPPPQPGQPQFQGQVPQGQFQQPQVPQQGFQQVPQQGQFQQVPQGQFQQVPQGQFQQVPQQGQQFQQVPQLQQVPQQQGVPVQQVQQVQQVAGGHHHPQGQQRVLHKDMAHEREHMKDHMEVPIDTSNMSEQELQFHYFKMHDADGNNKLDGCELVKSLIHWHDQSNHDPSSGQPVPEAKIFKDEELVNMIDPILASDDKNHDGFIDYPEFVQAQQAAQAKAAV